LNGNLNNNIFYSSITRPYPYSLGILIEWKQFNAFSSTNKLVNYPYSLGILIEWKQEALACFSSAINYPYSLGILIEWKLLPEYTAPCSRAESLLARDIN